MTDTTVRCRPASQAFFNTLLALLIACSPTHASWALLAPCPIASQETNSSEQVENSESLETAVFVTRHRLTKVPQSACSPPCPCTSHFSPHLPVCRLDQAFRPSPSGLGFPLRC